MDNINEITRKVKSLETLKQYILKNYLEEINLDEELDLYNNLIKHFFLGHLDSVYDNELFDNMDIKTKSNILNIVHEYQNLCFYKDNYEYWLDSVDGVSIDDYNLIVYQLLDNFDFLIKLYLTGGQNSLELLNNFSNSKYRNEQLSVVEDVRRNFVSDEVLYNVFYNMSKENSDFSVFTKEEKNTLLEFAEGTLYLYSKDSVKIIDSIYLILEIYYRMNGSSYNINNKDDFSKVIGKIQGFFKNDDNFDMTIMNMYYEYQSKYTFNPNLDTSKVENVSKQELKDKWVITDQSLLLDVSSPMIITSLIK